MTMRAVDPLLGPSRGDAGDAIAFARARGADAADYLRAVWHWAPIVGVDASIVAAQSAHETDDWTSTRWKRDRNPAGIGIPADASPQPFPIPDQESAAVLHVQCLYALVTGRLHDDAPLWPAAAAWLDRVWLPKVNHPNWPGALLIQDLNRRYAADGDLHATWAWDAEYAPKLLAKGRRIFPGLPNAGAASPGEPPMPNTPVLYDLRDDYARFGLTKAQADLVLAHRFPDRRYGGVQGRIEKIVLHIQAGNTRGSLAYWTGVDASSTVMIQYDGSILRVIPEQHAPWTNGDVLAPNRAAIADLLAWNANLNIWCVTCEAEGQPFETRPGAQLDAIEWWCRDIMARYPAVATIEDIERHADINTVNRPNCPGPYADIIRQRIATTVHPVPKPEPSKPNFRPDWLTERWIAGGEDAYLVGPSGKRQKVYACRRRWQARVETSFSPSSAKDRAALEKLETIPANTTFIGVGVYRSHGAWWILDEAGRRAYMGDMTDAAVFGVLKAAEAAADGDA